MGKTKILVGLEIGTSKTCMVVGEIRSDASAAILGIGEVPSAGVRAGEISDLSMARQCVCDAWQLAQDHTDIDILSVYLSVTGRHIIGENNRGSYRLPDKADGIITEEHVNEARKKAMNPDISDDRFAINRELGKFRVDALQADSYQESYNPIGLSGRTIDVDCHIAHGIKSRLMAALRCVRQVPLEVRDLVFAPLATAQMVLSRQQKDAGALLIDIGGGTTDYICYLNDEVIASGCVPFGGNDINKKIIEISGGRINNKAAEILKCTEGNAAGDAKDRSLAHYRGELGLHEVAIPRGELNRGIRECLGDALLKVRQNIPEEIWQQKGMAVYFSGGTSLMRGLDFVAQRIFYNKPIYQPAPLLSGRESSYLEDPRLCTAIGLIRYAQQEEEEEQSAAQQGLLKRIINIFLGRN